MKILVVTAHVGTFRHFDGVVRRMCESNHTVQALFSSFSKSIIGDRGVRALLAEGHDCQVGLVIPRQDRWCKLLRTSRELLNYSIYLKPEHTSPDLGQRWTNYLPRSARIAVKSKWVRKILAQEIVQTAMRRIERMAPPDAAITSWLSQYRPDVVVAVSNLPAFSGEVDYLKAAKALNIRTVLSVVSWDNLTTKGTFHVVPDLVFLWNRALLEEVVCLHRVPRPATLITGAPTFDYLFEMKPSADKLAFCQKAGIPPARPFVLYLCSSTTIAGDETSFAREFARALAEHPATRGVTVLIRPHPLNPSIWDGFSADNAMVWPPAGDVPDTVESKQDYYNAIFHSTAVVGINTSALLEAAILDKPCVTIMTERYRQTQTGMGHFHHLLNADFLDTTRSFTGAAAAVAAALHGVDPKAANRRRFVAEFIRPVWLDRPVSEVMAQAIEMAAIGQSAEQIELALNAGKLEGLVTGANRSECPKPVNR